jgi:hypothetical protein
MTLIVGMHLGSYVLLAADTRVTYYSNEIRMFRDDFTKIRRTSMGLVSGAGIVELLDPVQDRLKAETIAIIDRIVEIVQEQLTVVKKEPWAGHPRNADAIEHTGWMCTFIGSDNSRDPPTHPLRLGVVGAKETLIQSIPFNDVFLLTPTGTTPEQWTAWYRFAKDNLQPLADKAEVADIARNIAHHARVARDLMERVSLANDGVAKTLQLGVHIYPFLTGTTGIIQADGEISFEWSNGDDPLPPDEEVSD